MIEQLNTAIVFKAFFVESKLGKTGLTVPVDVYDPAGNEIVTAGAATEVGDGLYSYTLASGSVTTEGEYVCIFKTATDTVDQQHIPSLWTVGRAGIEHLDAAVSSRLSTAGYTAPANSDIAAIKAKTDNLPSDPADASDIAASFASIAATLSTISGFIDTEVAAIKAKTDNLPTDPADQSAVEAAITAAQTAIANAIAALNDLSAAEVWAHETRTLTSAGSGGATAEEVWEYANRTLTASPGPTAAAIRAEIDANSTQLAGIKAKTDNLPAAPAATGDIPSAAAVATQVRTELSTELGRIDAAISTRAAAATALSTADWTAARAAKLDNLDAAVSSVGGGSAPTAGEIADAVWDEAIAEHATAGSAGAGLQAAQAAGDPLSVELPGPYSGTQAGALIAKLNVGEPEDPVIPVPAPGADPDTCLLFGYCRNLKNEKAANVPVTIQLLTPDPAGNFVIVERTLQVKTDSEGLFSVALNRTLGQYRVVIPEARIDKTVELVGDTFDITEAE